MSLKILSNLRLIMNNSDQENIYHSFMMDRGKLIKTH